MMHIIRLRRLNIILAVNSLYIYGAAYKFAFSGKTKHVGRTIKYNIEHAMYIPTEQYIYTYIPPTRRERTFDRVAAVYTDVICVWNGGRDLYIVYTQRKKPETVRYKRCVAPSEEIHYFIINQGRRRRRDDCREKAAIWTAFRRWSASTRPTVH